MIEIAILINSSERKKLQSREARLSLVGIDPLRVVEVEVNSAAKLQHLVLFPTASKLHLQLPAMTIALNKLETLTMSTKSLSRQ